MRGGHLKKLHLPRVALFNPHGAEVLITRRRPLILCGRNPQHHVVGHNRALRPGGKHLHLVGHDIEPTFAELIDHFLPRVELAVEANERKIVRESALEVADESLAPVSGEESPLDALSNEAMKGRPELVALDEQIRAQLQTVSAIKGAYGPTLDATAGATQGGTRIDDLGWNLSVGVTLTWQIYQGGFTTAQVHEAEATAGQLAAQLDLLRQQVRLDVEQASLAIRAAKAVLAADRETVVNARDRLRLAEGRYETGVGSAIELGDAQVALTTAEAQTVQAENRLSTARAQLLRALGRQ